MEMRIGGTYETACAELRWREDGRIYYIPVFDHLHADTQFGFPHQHYHIDGRFELDSRMRHYFQVVGGCTSAVIQQQGIAYELLQVTTRMTKCVELATSLRLPDLGPNAELYQDWYRTYLGKKCPGRRCPHYGTGMLEKDGLLVCPMHGLTAELSTVTIIPRY